LGSAIFAFLAAGAFRTIEEAQKKLCPPHRVFQPEARSVEVYDELYGFYRKLYFGFGCKASEPAAFGDVLPELRRIAHQVRNSQ
jgi:L-ribulokinase